MRLYMYNKNLLGSMFEFGRKNPSICHIKVFEIWSFAILLFNCYNFRVRKDIVKSHTPTWKGILSSVMCDSYSRIRTSCRTITRLIPCQHISISIDCGPPELKHTHCHWFIHNILDRNGRDTVQVSTGLGSRDPIEMLHPCTVVRGLE